MSKGEGNVWVRVPLAVWILRPVWMERKEGERAWWRKYSFCVGAPGPHPQRCWFTNLGYSLGIAVVFFPFAFFNLIFKKALHVYGIELKMYTKTADQAFTQPLSSNTHFSSQRRLPRYVHTHTHTHTHSSTITPLVLQAGNLLQIFNYKIIIM